MNGVYGTKKPADIVAQDIEIFYYYRPTLSSEDENFKQWKKLDSNILTSTKIEGDSTPLTLTGMYDLKLPLEKFNKVGYYYIYIRPKEIKTKIQDVSVLTAYENVRGIVIENLANQNEDINNADFVNGGLVGYRVEYIKDGAKTGTFRIITSNNKCEPQTKEGKNTYNFNNSSNNLFFCTLTPSVAMSFNTVDSPFIGEKEQEIYLINTKFNPISLEIEITDKDVNSIATMLEGKQIRNLNKGLITTFTEDGEIYHQAFYGNITNQQEGINHDFKFPNTDAIDTEEKTNLDKIEKNLK